MPELFFGSLIKRYAGEMVGISHFSLRSAPEWDRGQGERRGLRTHTALNRDRYWLSALSLLAAFALYAGVRAQTPMGMGQVRLTEDNVE